MAEPQTPRSRALDLARSHYAAITRAQLRHIGFSDEQVDNLCAGGWVARSVRGVYTVAGSPLTWRQTAMVAVLAGPRSTLASHMTAAALHGLGPPPPVPHVIVPARCSGRARCAIVHHATVDPRDRATVDSIPCTGVARTLVDCAALLDRATLAEFVDTALCEGKASVRAVLATLRRVARPRGAVLLRGVLDAWDGPIRADSPAEVRLLRKLEEWGYPRPERQAEIRDGEGTVIAHADLGWPDRRLGLDYDSLRWHNPRAWAHDESRHRAVTVAGWRLLHPEKPDLLPGETAFRDALGRVWRKNAA